MVIAKVFHRYIGPHEYRKCDRAFPERRRFVTKSPLSPLGSPFPSKKGDKDILRRIRISIINHRLFRLKLLQ